VRNSFGISIFYSNLCIHSNDSRVHFNWIRGSRNFVKSLDLWIFCRNRYASCGFFYISSDILSTVIGASVIGKDILSKWSFKSIISSLFLILFVKDFCHNNYSIVYFLHILGSHITSWTTPGYIHVKSFFLIGMEGGTGLKKLGWKPVVIKSELRI